MSFPAARDWRFQWAVLVAALNVVVLWLGVHLVVELAEYFGHVLELDRIAREYL